MFTTQFSRLCHPERSEGSAVRRKMQIPCFARDDNSLRASLVRGPEISAMSKLLALFLLFAGALATAQEITVAAAADMSAALPQLVADYTKKTGQAVKLSFGASGNLTNQIRNGAPFDVLFSADEEYPQQLIAEGLASKDTLYRYAVGRLVIVYGLNRRP